MTTITGEYEVKNAITNHSKVKTCIKCGTECEKTYINSDGIKTRIRRKQSLCLKCKPIAKFIFGLDDKIKEDFPKYGKKWCMDKYHLNSEQVRHIIRKHNLYVEENGPNGICSNRKYLMQNPPKVNHKQFINIDNPIPAYLLGLIWTDGYVKGEKCNQIYFTTTEPDSNYFITQFVKVGEWSILKGKPVKAHYKTPVKFSTTNKILKDFLISCSMRKKHLGLDLLVGYIPKQFLRYFLRGVIDGDGCFYYLKDKHYKLSISSCHNQNWDCLSNIFLQLGIGSKVTRLRTKYGSNSHIEISGKDRVKKFGEWLYLDYLNDGIGLPRKYNKWISIRDSCGDTNNARILMPENNFIANEVSYNSIK